MTAQYGLSITVCGDAYDAIAHGYNYRAPDYKAIRIAQVVVVNNGTESGKPTVDFILEDEAGQKYVVMVSGALLKSIPC